MTAIRGPLELHWVDGTWSGDPALVELARNIADSGDTIEVLPFGEYPADDDCSEVVGAIMAMAFYVVDDASAPPPTLSGDGMRSSSAKGDYDASGIVY